MTRRDPAANNTTGATTAAQPGSTAETQPHEDQHLIWMLGVIAEWLEHHASDATRAELASFIGRRSARGSVLHLIDTAALWANQLSRDRFQACPDTKPG